MDLIGLSSNPHPDTYHISMFFFFLNNQMQYIYLKTLEDKVWLNFKVSYLQ